MLGLIGNRAEVRYLPQSLITDVPRMVAGLRVGQSFSAIPVSGQAVLMGAQAACLLIFVPDTVELAVSGPRSCCSLLERQRAAAGSLPRSSGVGGRSSTCPVAISITSLAAWLKSRGPLFAGVSHYAHPRSWPRRRSGYLQSIPRLYPRSRMFRCTAVVARRGNEQAHPTCRLSCAWL